MTTKRLRLRLILAPTVSIPGMTSQDLRRLVSDAEHLLEGARARVDRLRVGALLVLAFRGGETVAGAAVDFELERDLRGAQLIDHLADHRERIALVLCAVQDQEPALGVLRPSRGVVVERAVDRDICQQRRAGRAELDANVAAEAVADERDLRGVDHRALEKRIEPRLGAR